MEPSDQITVAAEPVSFADMILNLSTAPAFDTFPASGAVRFDVGELMITIVLLTAAFLAAQLMPTRKQRASLKARQSARAASAISRMR